MRLSRVFVVLLLFAGFSNALAWRATYSVKSLGIKVSTIELEQTERYLIVQARSVENSSIAPYMNNYYRSDFNAQCIPAKFFRLIDQTEDDDSVCTVYDHQLRRAKEYHKNKASIDFEFPTNLRDLFSALAYLSKYRPTVEQRLPIDGNGSIWNMDVSNDGAETLRTNMGRFNTLKYKINFSSDEVPKAPYVDMVSHNILNKDTTLYVWIDQSGIIVKAQVRRGLASMNWELNDFDL